MKKIWFTVLVFLTLIILAGCKETESEVVLPSFEVEAVLPSFEVEVVDIEGNVLVNESISYEENTDQSIIDLIDEKIGLDYDVYDFGVFIKGVSDFYPTEYNVTYNYYYSLYVDDELSNQGISDIALNDQMKISFKEVSTLDETDYKVDQLIQKFIENHLQTYINDNQIHYYVALAIAHLNTRNYNVPLLSSLAEDAGDLNRDNISNTFKASVFEALYNLPLDDTKTALESFETDNHYEAISLLTGLYITGSESELVDDLVLQLTSSTSPFMDGDYAGMVLSALAPYKDDEDVLVFVNTMLDYIQENQTSEGIEGWGGANSASTASVVLGLIAQGINPRDDLYTVDDIDLIESLLEFELDGAYKMNLTSDAPDTAFSTPQVFTALVAYKLYRDVFGNPAVNLFNLG